MAKKTSKPAGRRFSLEPAKPDDPIYQQGLVIFTPHSARPKPKEEPVEEEPQQE